jgi:vesicular inhibitory amino acid transporter
LGSTLVSLIVYSLDATRCVILHLAATQSLLHMFPAANQPPLWVCGGVVLLLAAVLVQARRCVTRGRALRCGAQMSSIAHVLLEQKS